MAQQAPSQYYRKGISLMDLFEMFPDDDTAEQWFIKARWSEGFTCPRCDSDNIKEGAAHKKLRAGRGTVGKTAVAGALDRDSRQVKAQVVERTNRETLQGFVEDNTTESAIIYTDDARAYEGTKREREIAYDRRHISPHHCLGQGMM